MTRSASTSLHSSPHISGYTIVEQLYLGSRTAVYRAVQNAQQRPVVIKVLRREYPSFGELVQFRNQYTIAKNLPIPGIVQPLSLEPLGSGYALVMEDFGGVALGKYVQQQSLDLGQILAIGLQIADILHDLGQHHVVHKDIKPANILIHPESKQVKLIDFSIASLLPRETQEIQSLNVLEGTLAYLAPEQTGRMNRGIDYRADFYALGVTLYQLLTGTLPFTSDDPLELMHCHIAKLPVPADQVKADVPERVAAIVTKLMAKNAEDRYQSALGLKHDLNQCLIQWRETGAIGMFDLGQRDLSDRFLIPEQLYGREAEVQALLAAFSRVAESGSELMLVAGFSGIGKTAVVNEVHKPMAQGIRIANVRQRGYFIKGKFDQFNRNIPFSAFVQALRDLMRQLLSESDAQLAQWQAQILAAVGENGQVLIEVIPELEEIIGKQPIAPELTGNAARNRFNLLFQNFIGVFTTVEHPLVIFLDDLQWADSASLQLLKLLMSDNDYLLVLGAYRDNEVSPVHPFILTVAELQKTQTIVNTITLAPLAVEDTNHLVADALNCSTELAQPLTELIDRKTKGNPFFTTQFLKALHDEGQIRFNDDRRYWECDIAQVNALVLTDDVVEFMAQQLQKLPVDTQRMLKLAACIGNQFDLTTLAIVSEQSSADTATALWKALQEGLILPTSQVYKFFQESEPRDTQSPVNPKYRFLHDRVQQAAYHSIPEDQRLLTHWQIGNLLLKKTSAQKEENLFEIINHLNIGKALITNLTEQIQRVRLNLSAGMKAQAANAYAAAVTYFLTGLDGLPQESWQNHYELMLSLHTGLTEALYLSGDFEQMEAYAEITLNQAQDLLEQVPVYNVKIQAYMAQSRHSEALKLALKVLHLLGVELPEAPTQADVEHSLEQTKSLLIDKTTADLLELPVMSDRKMQAAMQLLSSIISAAYQAAPVLFRIIVLRQVQLSIGYGNAPESTYAYATYGLMLCGVLGDIEAGYALGQMSLQLVDRLNAIKLKSKTLFAVNCFVRHWKDPVQATLSPLVEAYTCGLETGDIEYAMMSAYVFGRYAYLSGQELEELSQAMAQYGSVMNQLKQTTYLHFNGIYHQSVLNLLGTTANPGLLVGESYDEVKMLPLHQAANQVSIICQLHFCKLILSYLFHQYDQALENATIVKQSLASVTGLVVIPVFYFYQSLTQLARFTEATTSEQDSILREVMENQAKLKRWAQFAPQNYNHKVDLVQAEQYRILTENLEAVEYYDRAIAGAKENGYIQEEALANELAAKFYLEWGKEKIAQNYLTNAYYGYGRWGAKAKVQDLERHYANLLTPILQQQHPTLSATETVFAHASLTSCQTPSSESFSGGTSISATLDLATVLKASQTLSSEIQLDKLLATLLHTVLENAGADKGALLMPREQEWFVEAAANLDRPAQVQPMPLSTYSGISHRLINTVKRSLQPVVIMDAVTHPALATDAYVVQQQPKSLLCTPILQQGKLAAILYLENHVTIGAFTRDRVELLNFLCAQAAISLENARLYQQAQTYAQQLEQSQLQIVQNEKMASLGNLVAGVAHEINNPIGFLSGSINNAKDYVQDLLEHLALYQQHYPDPAAPVQDHAEEIDLEFLSGDLPKLLDSMSRATDRIKSISTSLRTFSRADAEYKVNANLHEGIDSTLLILKYRLKANEHRPAIEVICNYGDLPEVKCFPGQLNQVFMNILANAIDVLDEMVQGRSFEDNQIHAQQICITTAVLENHIEIRIRDNGKGMPKAVQQKIFNHLFTTKGVGRGTGLGLTIARQIVVEKHGGDLEVQSEVGQGTEFLIRLPIQG